MQKRRSILKISVMRSGNRRRCNARAVAFASRCSTTELRVHGTPGGIRTRGLPVKSRSNSNLHHGAHEEEPGNGRCRDRPCGRAVREPSLRLPRPEVSDSFTTGEKVCGERAMLRLPLRAHDLAVCGARTRSVHCALPRSNRHLHHRHFALPCDERETGEQSSPYCLLRGDDVLPLNYGNMPGRNRTAVLHLSEVSVLFTTGLDLQSRQEVPGERSSRSPHMGRFGFQTKYPARHHLEQIAAKKRQDKLPNK